MGESFDPNMLANLAGVEKSIHTEINKMWNEFRKMYKNTSPTPEAILNFAQKVREKYGKYYITGG